MINKTEITQIQEKSSVSISAKEMACVAMKKRKQILYAVVSSVITMCAVIAFFVYGLNTLPENAGTKVGKEVTENYLVDWPSMPSDHLSHQNHIAKKEADKTVTKYFKEGSNKPQQATGFVSVKSMLGTATKATALHPEEITWIKTELLTVRNENNNAVKYDAPVRTGEIEVPVISLQHKEFKKAEKKDRNFAWYAGIGFNTQFRNNNMMGENSVAFPMQDKTPSFLSNYNGSIRIGFVYNKKWMATINAGYFTVDYRQPATFAAESAPRSSNLGVSLEASRIFMFDNIGVKTGLNFAALRNNDAAPAAASFTNGKWMYRPGVNVGLVGQLSSHMQLQFGPNAWYNTGTSFRNHYSGPKPFGFGFDLSLHFRIY